MSRPNLSILSLAVASQLPGKKYSIPEAALCHRVGCDHVAAWTVGARCWAVGAPRRDDNYLELQFGVQVCGECRAKLKIRDVVTKEGWRRITRAIRAQGKMKPARSSLQLVFTAIVAGHA